VQHIVGALTPTCAVPTMVRAFENERLARWVFNRYLEIAPPSFVQVQAHARARPGLAAAAA
jgi:hypothetical protein